MAVCVQGLDSAVLYLPVTSRQSDGAKIRKESIYEAFILAAYVSYNSCYQVIPYICSVKMVLY